MFKGQIPAPTASSPLLVAPESLRIKQLEEQASALRNSVICAFNQLLDLKDLNTGVHSTRLAEWGMRVGQELDRKSTRLNSSHGYISYAVFCLKKKKRKNKRYKKY